MRLTILAILMCLSIGLASSPSSVAAQPPQAGQAGIDVEARLSELRVRLGLDATQTNQVRGILVDARTQMDALRASAMSGPRGPGAFHDFRQRRRAILFQVEDRIWTILTCPQKDAFRLYIREQMEERLDGPAPGAHPGGRGRR